MSCCQLLCYRNVHTSTRVNFSRLVNRLCGIRLQLYHPPPPRVYCLCGMPPAAACLPCTTPSLTNHRSTVSFYSYFAPPSTFECPCLVPPPPALLPSLAPHSRYTPFVDNDDNDDATVCRNILRAPITFPKSCAKKENAKDLVRGLLQRNPGRRLGCGSRGAREILQHPFYETLDWDDLMAKRIKAPWTPKTKGAFDATNFGVYDEEYQVAHFKPDADAAPWDDDF